MKTLIAATVLALTTTVAIAQPITVPRTCTSTKQYSGMVITRCSDGGEYQTSTQGGSRTTVTITEPHIPTHQ